MSKDNKEKGVVEDPEAFNEMEEALSAENIQDKISRTEEYVKKNRNLLTIVGVSIFVVFIGVLFYNYYIESRNNKAQVELFPAVFLMEKDSVDKALAGDEFSTIGLEQISKNFSGTKAAELAELYAGIAYMKKKEFEKAVASLKSFSTSDDLLQARAYCLLGDAKAELKQMDEAANWYKKAIAANEDERFQPEYIFKLALLYDRQGNKEDAIGYYQRIVDDYKDFYDYSTARKYLAKLK